MNEKSFLCIEFINADGERVKELSKFPATPDMVMASLQFLTKDSAVTVSVREAQFDEGGKIVNSPFAD